MYSLNSKQNTIEEWILELNSSSVYWIALYSYKKLTEIFAFSLWYMTLFLYWLLRFSLYYCFGVTEQFFFLISALFHSALEIRIIWANGCSITQSPMNRELPDVQAGFRKGRGTRDQIANIRWIMEKAREFQKNIYFCFVDYAKAFDCVDHNKLWKILKDMGIADHLTCLLRNLYAGQEATVRTGHETTDWFHIGKGICQGCILSPCLFNLYAEYIMRNAGLEEAQAGIKEKYQ